MSLYVIFKWRENAPDVPEHGFRQGRELFVDIKHAPQSLYLRFCCVQCFSMCF